MLYDNNNNNNNNGIYIALTRRLYDGRLMSISYRIET